jgi:MFS family permease
MSAPGVARAGALPLDNAPVSIRQIVVLLIALLLSALDGYDALSMAFVAPVLAKEWVISKSLIGLMLSASLMGMAVGALGLAPLADKFGRKPVVLGAIGILVTGTTLSALATSPTLLIAARLFTGVGIGVMVAMTTLLSAEFTSIKRRPLAVAAVATIGLPMGGVIGGIASAAILKAATWHWVFLAGSIGGLVLFVLVLLALPESPSYLITRGGPEALDRTNRALSRLGHPALAELPPAVDRSRIRYAALFTAELRPVVVRLTVVAVLIATASYYILNWLPAMVVDAGFTAAQGSLVSAKSGVIGLIGGVVFAVFAQRFAPTKVAAIAMTAAACGLAAVGLVPPVINLFILAAGVLGFCLAGTTGMVYTILANTFPAELRASGMGFVMGVMRIASATGPAMAGFLFAHGMTRAGVSLIFAAFPLIAAMLIATLPKATGSDSEGEPSTIAV